MTLVTGQPDTTINVETTLADITTTTLAEQETTTTIMVTEPPEQTTTSEAEDTTTTTIKATTEPEQIITTSVEETTTETNGNNIETAPPEATIDPAMTETAGSFQSRGSFASPTLVTGILGVRIR